MPPAGRWPLHWPPWPTGSPPGLSRASAWSTLSLAPTPPETCTGGVACSGRFHFLPIISLSHVPFRPGHDWHAFPLRASQPINLTQDHTCFMTLLTRCRSSERFDTLVADCSPVLCFGQIVVAELPAPTEPFPIRPCIVGRLSSPCSDALCVCHRHVAFENNLVSMLQLLIKVSVASQHFAIIVITFPVSFACTKLLYYFHAFIRVYYSITPYWLTLNERSPDSFIYFYFFFLIRHSFFLNLTLINAHCLFHVYTYVQAQLCVATFTLVCAWYRSSFSLRAVQSRARGYL